MLSMSFIIGLLGVIAIGWFWHDSLGVRERANRAAQDACERMHLQFLDGTVAFAQMRLARAGNGRISLRRTYVFDYTAGSIERRQGFLVFLGNRLETLGFEPHQQSALRTAARMDDRNDSNVRQLPSSPGREPADGDTPAVDDKVLDLNEWRARRARRPRSPDRHTHDTWQ